MAGETTPPTGVIRRRSPPPRSPRRVGAHPLWRADGRRQGTRTPGIGGEPAPWEVSFPPPIAGPADENVGHGDLPERWFAAGLDRRGPSSGLAVPGRADHARTPSPKCTVAWSVDAGRAAFESGFPRHASKPGDAAFARAVAVGSPVQPRAVDEGFGLRAVNQLRCVPAACGRPDRQVPRLLIPGRDQGDAALGPGGPLAGLRQLATVLRPQVRTELANGRPNVARA